MLKRTTPMGSPSPLALCYTAHLLLVPFPNDACRIVRLWSAIRDINVGFSNDVVLWVHHRARTRCENKRLPFPGFNSWRAIGGIRH
jgi:hypothetical protein